MTSTLQNYEDPAVQQRPLKNLVSYLRQKEAAGVISLPSYESKDKEL
jgi:RNA-binding protein 15